MTWVRYDDQFPIHRKVAPLSDAAFRLKVEADAWCNRNTTDGIIRADELTEISKRGRTTIAAELVRRQLWHEPGHDCKRCPQPIDGWVIHDYLDYNPSAEKVAKEKAAKAERQQRWLAKKTTARRGKDATVDASRQPSHDASKDGPEDALETPTPPPPRPEGSGAEPRASGRRTAARGGNGGRNPENPDWRTLPPIGAPRDPGDADRARRGAAAARAQLRQPSKGAT